jgi:hypothetical protein
VTPKRKLIGEPKNRAVQVMPSDEVKMATVRLPDDPTAYPTATKIPFP